MLEKTTKPRKPVVRNICNTHTHTTHRSSIVRLLPEIAGSSRNPMSIMITFPLDGVSSNKREKKERKHSVRDRDRVLLVSECVSLCAVSVSDIEDRDID